MTLFLRCLTMLAAAGVFALVVPGVRADSWNEDVFGDLSTDPGAPTPLTIYHPTNFITADVGDGDFDVIALTVAEYHTFDSITLASYSGATQSFVGLQAGSVWTAGTGGSIDPTKLLGWTHFGPAAAGAGVGEDIFDDLSVPKNGSIGFTRPLTPGVYTMLVQDVGASLRYQLRFNLTYGLRAVGDFNNDFSVDGDDLAKWRNDYGVNSGSDANGDGASDGTDFLAWQRNANKDFSVGAVPEPSTLAVVVAGALCALAAKRRRLQRR